MSEPPDRHPGCIGGWPAAKRAMRSGRFVTRLDQYIFRQLFTALLVVTLGLAALIWLTQSLRFVELVVNRGLSFLVFLRLTGLLVPSFIAVILPITTYIAIQFVYYRLSGDRELTVMNSAGVSPFALARPALAVALLATGIGYGLTLWGVPSTLSSFRQYQWEIRNRMAAFLLQEGVFTPVSDKLTVYVRSRDQDGTLRGILVDDARDPTAHATILAERGHLLEGSKNPRVLLINGSRQEIDHQTGRLNMLTFEQNEFDLTDTSKGAAERPRDMSDVPLDALLHPTGVAPRDAPKWVAEGYKRLTTPLTTMSYAMVALVSALTGTFRRHGGFVRPLITIGIMVMLLAAGLAIGNLAARDNSLLPFMWVHAVLPGMICAWLLFGPRLLGARFRPAHQAN
jgi:lipopolysaccharide export system permease protein